MKKHIGLIIIVILLVASSSAGQGTLGEHKLSLNFESTPLIAVLNMIAQQNGLNLVISDEVTGEVSVRLVDVDISTALDAVLSANGYTHFMRDNVIVIKATESVEAAEMGSRVVSLQYLDPVTAQKALESNISDKGKVIILDKQSDQVGQQTGGYAPNRILITDYPANIDRLIDILSQLDIRERSILIEARIIETKLDDDLRLGLNWPSSITAKGSGVSDGTSTSFVSTASNRALVAGDLNNGRWVWGKLSIGELQVVLDLLEQTGNSRLVSDPRITTIENHEAEFKFQTVIPIQTVSRFTEGASTSDIVTFEDEEIGISLRVTPRINGDGNITLDVHPTVEDIIGFSGPTENQKPITASRSIDTRITVAEGETVALGGLLKEDEIETVKRVPILGHIPILGPLLFTHKSVEKTKTDLIILITPHILD
ncbi:MAG: hypothetical protein JSU65_01115 [Candidatus Zixiibacteriota bacterium]|nr:MAG: hypothetical protein JSU65_01115 [candidate division Zixibacteria bacterium]